MNIRTVLDRSWREEGRVPPAALFAGAWLAQSILSSRKAGFFSRLAGVTLGAGAAALAAPAVADFARRGTTIDPLVPDAKELVTSGANAVSRNPMYAGLVGLLVARAVHRRSLVALAPAAVVGYLLDSRQIPAEEEVLSKRFGSQFEEYRGSTPRWLDARSVQRLRGMLPELETLPWFQRETDSLGDTPRTDTAARGAGSAVRRGSRRSPRSYPESQTAQL
jgi:protein-S-isoprenylcysteine O-methyltransferase Ste14